QADADVHVAGGPQDVTTPAGVRKPDVFVVARDVARTALERRARTYYGPDLLLVAEVITPRTVNEQIDRVRKVDEYAATGIPHYWLVDLEPRPAITMLELRGERYEVTAKARSGEVVSLDRPYPIAFAPVPLSEMDRPAPGRTGGRRARAPGGAGARCGPKLGVCCCSRLSMPGAPSPVRGSSCPRRAPCGRPTTRPRWPSPTTCSRRGTSSPSRWTRSRARCRDAG